jgi:fumarate reductase flavoprotein subunit
MAYQIKPFCLGCHYCALECPTHAIDYKGTQYQIDPEKCIECGKCVEVCNVSAIDTGEVPQVTPHDPIELETDVVIIGAGAGGSVAAVKLAQLTGKRIIVLEKAKRYGGSGWFASFNISSGGGPGGPGGGPGGPDGGPGGPGGPDGGPGGPAGGPPKRNQEYLKKLDQQLIANARQAGKDLNDWLLNMPQVQPYLVESEGRSGKVKSLTEERIFFNQKCTDGSIGPGKGGSFVIETMVRQFPDYGIQLLTEHAAKKILTDETGAVSGVLAQDPGGETLIHCKAVICASGSYTHNDELLRRFIPWFFPGDDNPNCERVHRFAAPTDTGDVVELGESCGAFVDYDAFCINLFGPVHHPFTFSMFCAQMNGNQMTVNMNGKRFYNEGAMGGGAAPIVFQPRRMAYSIFTEKSLEQAMEDGMRTRHGIEGQFLKRWKTDIQEELDSNNGVSLFVADTLEELAEKAGIDKEGFLSEVARYNHFCETGVDEDFGKNARNLTPIVEGPFYAIFGKMATDGAFGGVLVDPKCQVYKADKSGIIPGFYAVGDNASGVQANAGVPGDHRLKAFTDYQWAVNGAYLAAQSCAEYI